MIRFAEKEDIGQILSMMEAKFSGLFSEDSGTASRITTETIRYISSVLSHWSCEVFDRAL